MWGTKSCRTLKEQSGDLDTLSNCGLITNVFLRKMIFNSSGIKVAFLLFIMLKICANDATKRH